MTASVALAGLVVSLAAQAPPNPAQGGGKAAMVLPGVRPDGAVQLPNQWSLRPAGKQVETGIFPVNLALHPAGQFVAVLHAGAAEHEVVILRLTAAGPKVVSKVQVPFAFIGLAFSPDGRRLAASGGEGEVVHVFPFDDGYLGKPAARRAADRRETFVVGGVAWAGEDLLVTGVLGHQFAVLPPAGPARRFPLPPLSHPYQVLPAGPGRAFVSLWGLAKVAEVDTASGAVLRELPTESHPTEMALAPDGKRLFVACANSTRVAVLNLPDGSPSETVSCALHPASANMPGGNTPSSLALSPDGRMLFVANSDANNLAVVNVSVPGKAVPLGFVPTGCYPTAVRYDAQGKRLFVANGKGSTPKANVAGQNPNHPGNATVREYVARLMVGTVSEIPLPDPQTLGAWSRQAIACSPLRADLRPVAVPPAGNPIPAKVGDPSPIKHVIYVVKENRTYDQVFGDVPAGNGDPNLCIFPERVTPNIHKLAREFVLLDNFYCDAEVSADGHEWTMAAYATDYVEKVWPLGYRGGFGGATSGAARKAPYPAEGGGGPIAYPSGGYLWDRCKAKGLPYRSYGEFTRFAPKDAPAGSPPTAAVPGLEGHVCPTYRGYDLNYRDVDRAAAFLKELAEFEAKGEFPRFAVVRLGNDHTKGTTPGALTPTAYVADNDLALGRIIEGLSRSRFWKETAVFVIEDDAQNGSDHVDAHRSTALVVSPYSRRRGVDSAMYSTTSMLRTMELILGLEPMSQFDAAARPMYGCFGKDLDPAPYRHEPARVDLNATNPPNAPGARASVAMDFTREDAADDLALNEVIWQSVKGAGSRMPAPVRAAFLSRRPPADHDD